MHYCLRTLPWGAGGGVANLWHAVATLRHTQACQAIPSFPGDAQPTAELRIAVKHALEVQHFGLSVRRSLRARMTIHYILRFIDTDLLHLTCTENMVASAVTVLAEHE